MAVVAARLEAERTAAQARLARTDEDLAALFAASRDSNADDEHDPEGQTIAYERAQLVGVGGLGPRPPARGRCCRGPAGRRHLRRVRGVFPADRRRAAGRPTHGPHLRRARTAVGARAVIPALGPVADPRPIPLRA